MKKLVLIKNKKSKKGFSLLELLLVLGIIAALVVAAFIVYPKVQASQRAEAESSNIAAIQAGVKSLYAASPSYTGLTTQVGVQANVFPDNMLSGSGSDATPINVFKGEVTLAAAATGPSKTAGSSFTITYNSVPANECAKIVSSIGPNFDSVTVGSGGTVVKESGKALDISATVKTCAGPIANKIVFTSL